MSKRLLFTGFFLIGLCGLAAAQPAPTREAGTRNVEVDPIRCWWRTSAGAVRIGEQFDVSLTCAVLESETVSVVVDESRLGNAVVQMAPFEVVSGSHQADIHEGIRRFFQYDYVIRIISPNAVGTDVRIPDVVLHYRVNSKVAANAAIQGRDLLYYLPPQVIRVESMVPAGASDIRDAAGASFASIDALTFRSGMFNIAGLALMAFGSLTVLLVLVRLARGARQRTPADQRELSTGALLGVVTRELAAVRKERDAVGWNEDLTSRALAAARVAAAGAIGHVISQRATDAGAAVGDGGLIAPGPHRGTTRVVSSPTTARQVSQYLDRLPESDSSRSTLEPMRDGLSALTTARFGRDNARNESALDAALDAAASVAAGARAQHVFPRTLLKKWTAGPARTGNQV